MYGVSQNRNVIFDSFKYQITIQFKVPVSNSVTLSNNIYPRNIRKV